MTLADTKIGYTYYVKKITLERDVTRRLQVIGMTNTTAVTVLNKKRRGALVLKVRGARFALGAELTRGIEVGGETYE
ncbi:MAG: FeoA domain-containing protein [Clostridia bacterium]|nr:FeoA domain-containing protein [Clostridia bacterium]